MLPGLGAQGGLNEQDELLLRITRSSLQKAWCQKFSVSSHFVAMEVLDDQDGLDLVTDVRVLAHADHDHLCGGQQSRDR
jgi:hypothetical protein